MRQRLLVASIALLLSGIPPTGAQSGSALVRAKRIYTVTAGILDNAEILVEGGKIAEIGQRVRHPPGVEVHDAEVVIPGMIDAHTHMALDRSTRGPGPVSAEWKAVDHFDPADPMIPVALSGGLTSVITRPGSGIVSSGQAVAIKLRSDPARDMVLKPFVDLKMAVRPLIKLRPGETPATVMGWYATAHRYFTEARAYLEERDAARRGERSTAPEVDERLEAFAAVLRGDAMLHAHAHYPSEIMMVLRLAREFGFADRLALSHASEAFPIADVLASTNVIPVVGPVMIVRFLGDARSHNVVKELMDAGLRASIQTDQSREQLKGFREYGAFLVRHGLSEAQALEAMTINGARAMMLDHRIGSIEVGKDADLVLMDGPPLDLHAERIVKVFVDGALEYARARVRQLATPTPVGPFTPIRGLQQIRDRSFAITNAHIFTVGGDTITRGTIVVRGGRIADVRAGEHRVDDLPVVDIGGRVVLPGWVTARAFPNTWIGDIKWQVQNDEDTEPIVPEMNARFGIDPWLPSFPVMREIGITSQHVTPGHLNLIGGRGVVIKTSGMDIDRMVRREPSALVFSLAETSVRFWARGSRIPVTLASAVASIRDTLEAARRYLAREDAPYDPRLEALRPALDRRIPVVVHANRVEEIRAALQLAETFDLRLIVSGGVEAHTLAADLARRGVPVILGDSSTALEAIRGGGRGYSDEAPRILSQAGVAVSFFGASGSRRGMPTGRLGGEPALNAAWVFRNGVPEAEAIRMFTLHPAEMLDLADEIGSIEVGKAADLQVLEGHPFDYRALPQLVFIDGELVVGRPGR